MRRNYFDLPDAEVHDPTAPTQTNQLTRSSGIAQPNRAVIQSRRGRFGYTAERAWSLLETGLFLLVVIFRPRRAGLNRILKLWPCVLNESVVRWHVFLSQIQTWRSNFRNQINRFNAIADRSKDGFFTKIRSFLTKHRDFKSASNRFDHFELVR